VSPWHEAIDLYKDFAADHPDVLAGRPLHVPNVVIEGAPALTAHIDAWRDESLRMGAAILRGVALGLGLDEDWFAGDRRAGDPFWVGQR
jgi:isopenicillin N synthase-like dioxygenase